MNQKIFSCFLACFFIAQFYVAIGSDRTTNRIKKAVDNIWLIDTHEHLVTEKGRMQFTTGFFYFVRNYVVHDLVSSGMSKEEEKFVFNENEPLDKRWEVFQPYWDKSKNTGYALCLRTAAKGLFGINEINKEACLILDKKLRTTNKKGWYDYVLKEKARIDISIVDPQEVYTKLDDQYPEDFFLQVLRVDKYLFFGGKGITDAKNQTGMEIISLTDYLNALDSIIAKGTVKDKIVGLKCGVAYNRELFFEDIGKDIAADLFDKMIKSSKDITEEESKKLQDFMMHHVIQQAVLYNLPIQLHTGMLAGNWNRNPIENTNARHLVNLFLKYPKAKFVLFHGNYPYMEELTYLAKSFPNVYIDMCWMAIISPPASKQYLEEWLLTVPASKIMAFGGDIGRNVEWVYGHAVMARSIVAEVLAKMVNDKYYTEEEAIAIAGMILRNNAIDLYNIELI
ncbi:MAG: amidohydrolase family protein [Mangrovibacterium sp.]|nr:amidohydrolase family protein [Mangrovibacterium sp.]